MSRRGFVEVRPEQTARARCDACGWTQTPGPYLVDHHREYREAVAAVKAHNEEYHQ